MSLLKTGTAPFGETWDADFSHEHPTPLHRYRLRRLWPLGAKLPLAVIGLNPSTADEQSLDPTVKRCTVRAAAAGHRGLVMLNLFAFRSTDPAGLRTAADPLGPENDAYLLRETDPAVCSQVICAWGTDGDLFGRGAAVVALLRAAGRELHCLKLTKNGHPQHPLYLGYGLKPQVWRP